MTLYPAIDIIDGQCVRLMQGDYGQKTVYGTDPVSVAKRWQDCGARWLHTVDLDGARAGRPVNNAIIRKIAAALRIPVQVGGGNRTMADIEARLNMGVARVILGTAALRDPAFTREAAARYGARVAVGVDARDGRVAVSGWMSVSETGASELMAQLRAAGVKTVVYTDIAKDGMMAGPNFEMYREAAGAGLEVIASGGVSCMDDLARLADTGVSGAIIGKALYVDAIDLREAVRLYDGYKPTESTEI